jgi:nicotinamidase-related amidase
VQETVFKGTYTGTGKAVGKRALLVIDVQNEYFTGKLPVCYPENTLPNILLAVDTAKAQDIPVVIVQHSMSAGASSAFVKGSAGWELHDAVKKIEPDHYVEKHLPSSFVGTDLQSWLDANGIDTVVISGYMTQFCCDTTARYAMHLGYNVEFLSDGTATLGFENGAGKVSAEELHRAILVVQASRFSHVMTTAEWIGLVSKEA